MTSDALYTGIVAKLAPVFDKLGTTYTVRAEGVYDPATLSTVEGATRSVVGVVTAQSVAKDITGGVSGDWSSARVLVLRADAVPQAGEEVLVDAIWHSLSKVEQIKPAAVVVAYTLGLSR
jgi:isopentenyl phosphate kinase